MDSVFAASSGFARADLEAAPARRLGAAALIFAAICVPLGALEHLTAVAHTGLSLSTSFALLLVMSAASLAAYFLCSRGRFSGERILDLGVLYEISIAFLLALSFHAGSTSTGQTIRGWTPTGMWVLVFPLIVPTTTARVVLASVVSALTDPLALWINVAAGAAPPSLSTMSRNLLPSFVAAILAPVASRLVYRLSVEAGKAREMGSYRLVELLGRGGMGEVWRARHRMLARESAVKLIRPEALGDAGESEAQRMLQRFEREAQATAALRSPHTIELYDFGVSGDGTFYYVMELLEGFSLETMVARFGPVPPSRAVHLLSQICHSLAEAHHAGLVHRDIKPANIFACRRGMDLDFVKVLDFGLVKDRKESGAGLTIAGTMAGTPGYIPPEVALGKSDIDGRADIYALGCVAYWLLTGRPVFEGTTAMEVVVNHVRTPPVPPSRRSGRVFPEPLERLVLECLEKEPERRPQTVVSLAESLKAIDLAPSWTRARMEEWWSEHRVEPETPELGDSGARTYSTA